MTGSLLKEIISEVQKMGVVIVGVVSDMGGKNKRVWKDLEVDYKKSCFDNPSDATKRIWVFQDVPHMLKLLRNHFIDDGFTLPSGKIINKTIIENILSMDGGEIKICPKLKYNHLMVSGRDRQRVRPACELFSNHVAQTIKYLLSNEHEASEYFKLVNDVFDIFNSRIPDSEIPIASGFGKHFEDQEIILRKFRTMCEKMRVGKNTSLLPFQKGFMMSIRSLLGCFSDLRKLYGLSYILTARLNQDCLENLFSQIRALGRTYDHPLPVEFKNRLRLLIMSRNISDISFNSSAVELEEDTNDYLTSNLFAGLLPDMTEALAMIENDSEISEITIENLPEVRVIQNVPEFSSEGLRYLAGYIAFRCREVDRSLGDPTGQLISVTPDALPVHQGWIEKLSRGGLLKPSDEWLCTVKQFEVVFVGVHGDTLNCCNVIKGMCNILAQKFPHVHPLVIKIYTRTRTFIRIRSLNTAAKTARAAELQRKKARKWQASARC